MQLVNQCLVTVPVKLDGESLRKTSEMTDAPCSLCGMMSGIYSLFVI